MIFCSLYNNMKRSRNIPRFHSKQTCMSMWRRPRGQTALGALWWTIFYICSRFEHKLPQYPENTLDKIRLRDNISSLHKICQIWCMTAWIAVKRLDVKIYIWLLTSVTRAQPHAPSRLSGGEHGLIPEQRLDTEPRASCESILRDGEAGKAGRFKKNIIAAPSNKRESCSESYIVQRFSEKSAQCLVYLERGDFLADWPTFRLVSGITAESKPIWRLRRTVSRRKAISRAGFAHVWMRSALMKKCSGAMLQDSWMRRIPTMKSEPKDWQPYLKATLWEIW